MHIRKITLWRIAIFTVAAIGVLTAFWLINYTELQEYKRLSNQTDRRSFAQLCEAVSSIDSELSRSRYATGSPTQLFRISNEVSRHSEAAKTALAALPSGELGLDRTSEFLTLAADYCSALALKSASGIDLTQEDIEGLKTLSQSSNALSNELNSLYLHSDSHDFFSDIASQSAETSEAVASFASGMSFAEENMPESPVLIYDGPYSSHITEMTAAFLENAAGEVSVVEGLRIAAKFLGRSDTEVKYICRTDGDIQTFTYSDAEDKSFVSVTVTGGNVISYSQNAEVADIVLTGENAAEIGAEFLAQNGYKNLSTSYWYCANGICYINYHHAENDVVVYPDLIQLGIRLDSGEATYMNAFGYLWNHRDGRNIAPEIDQKAAKETVSQENSEYVGLCIIPSDGKNEILCHEFKCTAEDETHCLIYVNSQTGAIEKIFVLVENENGTLTV